MSLKTSWKRYLDGMEKFYMDLAGASKRHGYFLDFLKGEAPPCKERGEPVSTEELLQIYGSDLPKDWRWRYNVFLESEECLLKVLRDLSEKGYKVAFNFTAPDAFLGNVTVKIYDKWFAIGDCTYVTYATTKDGLIVELADIRISRLWSPFYVLSNIKCMETQLALAQSIIKAGEWT
ncbi:MAG: hypothetical protein ACUVRA_09395 [Candidatus Bathyarchaeaceae archaeon]